MKKRYIVHDIFSRKNPVHNCKPKICIAFSTEDAEGALRRETGAEGGAVGEDLGRVEKGASGLGGKSFFVRRRIFIPAVLIFLLYLHFKVND
ncbi:MAG: hypothetical protein IJ745_05270 [Bacteroidales bacterium]|nr:hypothetical protein [Bacteroidales bacterium]